MKESVRLARFALIGTLNYLITLGVIWLLMSCLSFKGAYIVANVTAYLLAQTHNFVWCRYWIFPAEQQRAPLARQAMLFALAFALAYTVQFLYILCMIEVVGMNAYVAQFIGIVIYGALFFVLNKKMTFH